MIGPQRLLHALCMHFVDTEDYNTDDREAQSTQPWRGTRSSYLSIDSLKTILEDKTLPNTVICHPRKRAVGLKAVVMALQVRKTSIEPLSFAPSQVWEGNDGPWSTFAIRVGTPEQIFHVLVSTTSQETWVPVPEGCTSSDPTDCGALRGVLAFQNQPSSGFQVNQSSTWIPENLYELGAGSNLNYTGNGEYGFDTVGLQLPQSGGTTLKRQIVAGIATKDFILGEFGIGPKPTNFTSFQDPQPSYMWSLKNQSMIPSISWGYSAGARYQLKQTAGSLTLGGYDASRFVPNNVTFAFNQDDSRPLTVGVQAIQAKNTLIGTVSLLPSGILALIDSTVPEIWLPATACTIFESAFGLQYDAHTDRYLVNTTTHASLTSLNPVLSFKLGNLAEGGETVIISLPYKAFDLQASWPIYANVTNYFPLRRAANDSQYTMGRTFLQEAYVIADYERSNFSVSQCLFQENNPQKLVGILPPVTKGLHSSKLKRSILIVVILAVVVGFLLALSGLFIIFRIRRRRRLDAIAVHDPLTREEREHGNLKADMTPGALLKSQVYGVPTVKPLEMSSAEARPEMVGTDRDMAHELNTKERVSELPSVGDAPVELPASPHDRWSWRRNDD